MYDMARVGDLRPIIGLQRPAYEMAQVDYEISDILEYIGQKGKSFSYLFVRYDSSGADFAEVWGYDGGVPYLASVAECLFVKEAPQVVAQ